jgi:hypothetical protein
MRGRECSSSGYEIGLRAALSTPSETAAAANSTRHTWLSTPVFWQNYRVTCDPNRDATPLPTQTAAPTAHLTAEPEATVENAGLAAPTGGPGDARQGGGAPGSGTRGDDAAAARKVARPREIGGREGLDPTRYGDWELRGRCIDF